jgi:hypothetical protein
MDPVSLGILSMHFIKVYWLTLLERYLQFFSANFSSSSVQPFVPSPSAAPLNVGD